MSELKPGETDPTLDGSESGVTSDNVEGNAGNSHKSVEDLDLDSLERMYEEMVGKPGLLTQTKPTSGNGVSESRKDAKSSTIETQNRCFDPTQTVGAGTSHQTVDERSRPEFKKSPREEKTSPKVITGGSQTKTILSKGIEDDKDVKLTEKVREGMKGRSLEPGEFVPHKSFKMKVIDGESTLMPYNGAIQHRYNSYLERKNKLAKAEGSLYNFANGFKRFGLLKVEGGISYCEWAPGAKRLSLFGDFNHWNRDHTICTRDEFGVWSAFLPDKADGTPAIAHNSHLKVCVDTNSGQRVDKIPAWIHYAIQDKSSLLFNGVFWNPEQKYQWKNPTPQTPKTVRIYESHVGMASQEEKVASYKEFTQNIIPKIARQGYTCVQLMAIMEHAYYGSFGYHVTNFFGISSRFGTPEELKELIDTAHEYGLVVLMDLVHSHASSNGYDGLNFFDGTDHHYFHGGSRGYHKQWDSKLFNYGHWEVSRFLLSNVRWYMEEYKFDGFRFDGITSMLYKHHGIDYDFVGGYDEYFTESKVDIDAMVYLMLVNDLIHSINPNAITIAEDVSGMPCLCRPILDGGFGFDYRLNMSVPDLWIKYLKEFADDHWSMGQLVHALTYRRHTEKHIAYVESHDQSIVGDKTLAMWLFDKEIYYSMGVDKPMTPVVFRGMALHKMIRLLTVGLGGEAYLNFIGNEFGHPEWVDFPREGNNYSHHHCRRQWNLLENEHLRYKFLNTFDRAMHSLEDEYEWMSATDEYITLKHEADKLIIFEKAGLLWIFNFHPSKSFEHYRVGTRWACDHEIIFDTDGKKFGGTERLGDAYNEKFPHIEENWHGRANYIQIYIPSRSAIILRPTEGCATGYTDPVEKIIGEGETTTKGLQEEMTALTLAETKQESPQLEEGVNSKEVETDPKLVTSNEANDNDDNKESAIVDQDPQ
mmetsp:Transcript_56574/g.64594  ORF Transcript_56574/g.64594 Transcript_56574/m.64594 type:complete len:927 (-) Transcript_56574:103-2883(-)